MKSRRRGIVRSPMKRTKVFVVRVADHVNRTENAEASCIHWAERRDFDWLYQIDAKACRVKLESPHLEPWERATEVSRMLALG